MVGGYARELTVAIAAVQKAASISRRVLVAPDKGVVEKPDHTPVTVADLAIQALLTATLHAAFPTDNFVGEESADALRSSASLCAAVWGLLQEVQSALDSGGSNPVRIPSSPEQMCEMLDWAGTGQPTTAGRFWIFDPIDGTKTFVRGENYAINVCLMNDGQQTVGVVGLPLLAVGVKPPINNDTIDVEGTGSIMLAVRGHGTYIRPLAGALDLEPTRIPPHSEGKQDRLVSVTCTDGSDSAVPGINQKIADRLGVAYPGNNLLGWVVRWAALGLGAANCTFWVYRSRERVGKIWDHAGAMLLFEETGGKVTDVDGSPISLTTGRQMVANYGFVAAPAAMHDGVLTAVKDTIREEGLHHLLREG